MTQPVIEAGDFTSSNNETADTTPDVSFASYVSGDLTVQWLNVRNNQTDFAITPPSTGPNGETLILSSTGEGGSGGAGPHQGIIAWIGNDTVAGSTLAWAIASTGERWAGRSLLVPAGEFNATTPLAVVSGYSGQTSGTGTTLATPSWTIGSGDANGTVVVGMVTDIESISATPTGWSAPLVNTDHGSISAAMAVRTAATTASETIASVNYTIDGDGDTGSCVAVVVREDSSGINILRRRRM